MSFPVTAEARTIAVVKLLIPTEMIPAIVALFAVVNAVARWSADANWRAASNTQDSVSAHTSLKIISYCFVAGSRAKLKSIFLAQVISEHINFDFEPSFGMIKKIFRRITLFRRYYLKSSLLAVVICNDATVLDAALPRDNCFQILK
jgi:hypothetical protein